MKTPTSQLTQRVARPLAMAIAAGRTALGVAAIATPDRPLRPWVGSLADDRRAVALARALGGRDIAIGAAALYELRNPDRDSAGAKTMVALGGLADAVDVAATLLAFGSLPKKSRWLILAAAGGSAVASAMSVRHMGGKSAI